MKSIVSEAYQRSIELLKLNSTEFGYQAAPANPEKPEYSFLFGRDTSICALATFDHPDKQLAKTAVNSLDSLRLCRSDLGQVPFRADFATHYRDFWLPGNLDSTLWWVLASLKLAQQKPGIKASWQRDIEMSITWLRYQDIAEIGLLMQGHGSDWADEMPSHGAVLYSNSLWYKVVDEYIATYGSSALVDKAYQRRVHLAFNAAFWPYEDMEEPSRAYVSKNRALNRAITYARETLIKQPFYIQYLSRWTYGRRCDLFGNTLALTFGLASERQQQMIERYMLSVGAADPMPGRTIYPVIYPGELEWKDGMAARNQNIPHQYHNGGIWPFIGGFWVMYMSQSGAKRDRKKIAKEGLERLAEANATNDWEFNEYFHGEKATPMGIQHQSWNAAMYIAAYRAVYEDHSVLKTEPATKTDLSGQVDVSLDFPNLTV